jgi:hypothetical protein
MSSRVSSRTFSVNMIFSGTNAGTCESSSTGKGIEKQVERMVDIKLEEFHEHLADIEFKYGGPRAQ